MWGIGFILMVVLLFFATALKILREWERGVILRLGKFQAVRGPGYLNALPFQHNAPCHARCLLSLGHQEAHRAA